MAFIPGSVNRKPPSESRETLSFLSFAYFILLLVVTGLLNGFAVSGPLFLLGRFWPRLYHWGALCLQRSARWLIVAPVFRTEAELDLPGPCFTVSNHRSTLDAFILISRIPGVRLIAKASLFYIPFMGATMRAMGQIRIKKGEMKSYWKSMDEAENALKRGFHVHIFPEMTRCPRGFAGTQRFHLAPFKIALELQAKIFPVVFFNTDEAWPRGSLRMNRAVTVRAKTLPPLDAKAYPTSEALLQEVQGRINAALSAGWNNGL